MLLMTAIALVILICIEINEYFTTDADRLTKDRKDTLKRNKTAAVSSGAKAFDGNQDIKQNPHEYNSELYISWVEGWNVAREDGAIGTKA